MPVCVGPGPGPKKNPAGALSAGLRPDFPNTRGQSAKIDASRNSIITAQEDKRDKSNPLKRKEEI